MVYAFEKAQTWGFPIPRYPTHIEGSKQYQRINRSGLFFSLTLKLPYIFNQKIFRLKIMCFRIYKGSKVEIFSNFLHDFLKKSLEAVAVATDTQQKESTINYTFLCDNTQTEKV